MIKWSLLFFRVIKKDDSNFTVRIQPEIIQVGLLKMIKYGEKLYMTFLLKVFYFLSQGLT